MTREMIALVILLSIPAGGVAQRADHRRGEDHPSVHEDHGAVQEDADAAFEMIKSLVGEWEARLSNDVMTNTFRIISRGEAVMHEERLNGEQIAATVFYMVGPELRADHFCSNGNQPRYTATPSSDGDVVTFEATEVLNVDVRPQHFVATTWRFRDATHLTQEWHVVEPGRDERVVQMEFIRTK